jgi:hypothetical protein
MPPERKRMRSERLAAQLLHCADFDILQTADQKLSGQLAARARLL